MSAPPRRPAVPPPQPGAPPARPPPLDGSQIVRGVGESLQRPPGPPPGAPPSALKPPPMAPPPRNLVQSIQRPSPDAIKTIGPPRAIPPPRGAPPGAPPGMGAPPTPLSGRGPPPRAPPSQQALDSTAEEFEMMGMRAMAQPKFNDTSARPNAARKQGAIAMFEQEESKPVEPAESKRGPPPRSVPPRPGVPRPGPPPPRGVMADPSVPMVRTPRPLPPTPQPPGIPEGQPLPPEQKPEKEVKDPPPVKPAPNRNRAPPRGEPNKIIVADPEPPTTTPPFLRGVKVVAEEPHVPRRQRENPEFEASSDEEDKASPGDKPKKSKAVAPAPAPAPALSGPTMAPSSPLVSPEKALTPPPAASPPQPQQQHPGQSQGAGAASSPPVSGPSSHSPSASASASAAPPVTESANEKLANIFVAPPTTNYEPDFDSKIAKQLKRGRLSIRCIEGMDIRKHNDPAQVPRTDPYIKFRLGVAERHPWKQTRPKRKQTNFPKFDDEIISFDVLDPVQYVFQEDLQMVIEVWNKSSTKDEIMGSVTMSVVRFFLQPFIAYEEKIPIYYPGKTKTNSKLKLEFIFEEARVGMFCITLFEGKGLKNVDTSAGHQQSPYVQFSLGPYYKKKSAAVKGGGTQPYFAEEEVLLYADNENWVNDLEICLYDEEIGTEKPIGKTTVCLLSYMNVASDKAMVESFDLFIRDGDPRDPKTVERAHGEITLRLMFLPAGKLTLFLDRAKGLSFPDTHPNAGSAFYRMDPYAQFSMEGKAMQVIKKSPSDKDGGQDPVWQNEMTFDIVDQYLIDMEVYNQSAKGLDVLLGYAQISLLPVFRNGGASMWVPLKQKKANGGVIEVGNVKIDFGFSGPLGISYPQFRPEVDSFDDQLRKPNEKIDRDARVDDDDAKIKEPISTIPLPPSKKGDKAQAQKGGEFYPEGEAPPPQAEFSDEEIIAAFRFIDLDHNNFVGAKEIRHILVCMGELITDEEVDTMISMVDADGDGQVSFDEFRAIVLHPDPGSVDMHKHIANIKDEEISKEKQAMRGKTSGLDLSTFQRQREMTQRESKKKMLIQFVADNEVTFDFVKHVFQGYEDLPKEKRVNGRLKFEPFCKVLGVEPISEYRMLHGLFDSDETQEVDFREFLLSMMNFVEVDKELRMRFSFVMFDDMKSGYITQKEIEEILRGNHMISLASVQRKAETIMRQAKANSFGAITQNELVVISKKFPNILLPSVGK